MIQFATLLEKCRRAETPIPERLLCLDPGHTTGWCLFENGELTKWGQSDTVINRKGSNEGEISWEAMLDIFKETKPTAIICEDYRVYAHKLDRHTNSPVLTLRLIGAIDFYAWDSDIPINYQMASTAKGFATDAKLKEWDFWQEGMRHSRDAIRHGIYYLLFSKSS